MPNKNENSNCIIGEGSIFNGRFYVNGSILIEGKFQGDIRTDDQLTVGPSGKVKTDIVARRVTVAGTLIGNITASEEVSLLHTGQGPWQHLHPQAHHGARRRYGREGHHHLRLV